MGTLAEMLSTPLGVIEWFVYLLAAVMFVIGLHGGQKVAFYPEIL